MSDTKRVPREPTEQMVEAGFNAYMQPGINIRNALYLTFIAMYDAAPDQPDFQHQHVAAFPDQLAASPKMQVYDLPEPGSGALVGKRRRDQEGVGGAVADLVCSCSDYELCIDASGCKRYPALPPPADLITRTANTCIALRQIAESNSDLDASEREWCREAAAALEASAAREAAYKLRGDKLAMSGDKRAEEAQKDYDGMREFQAKYIKADHERIDAEARADRLAALLFSMGAMKDAPCFACGYNGPGYFQPDKHPCAAKHHAALREGER